MFTHNFKYSLKTLFKNKALIFWTFAFPLILGTFFNMAFSNLSSSEKLDVIDIAIVESDDFNNNEAFKTAFKTLSDKDNQDRLFDITYTSEDKAKVLLENNKIDGYLVMEEEKPKLVFTTNGINQTIFKYVTEEISGTSNIINNLTEAEISKEIRNGNYNINYESIYESVNKIIKTSEVKLNNISSSNLDYAMIEFYTLIAMTCLYGGIIGMTAINQNLANMSDKGKRVSVAPVKKSIVISSSVLASYLVQLIGLLLLFFYTIFILKVDYGNNFILVAILACSGSLAGLCLGLCVGTLLKVGEGAKVGILLGITMFGSFLSGMMGITLKYYIDKYLSLIHI